jgi:hypothetical protein
MNTMKVVGGVHQYMAVEDCSRSCARRLSTAQCRAFPRLRMRFTVAVRCVRERRPPPLLRLGVRRKRDTYIYESGKRQESMQHGWFLGRLIVIGSQASNRVCETCRVCRSPAELSTRVASFTKGSELNEKLQHCRGWSTPKPKSRTGIGPYPGGRKPWISAARRDYVRRSEDFA